MKQLMRNIKISTMVFLGIFLICQYAWAAAATYTYSINSTPSVTEENIETATFTITQSGDALTGNKSSSITLTPSGTAQSGTDYQDFVAAVTAADAAAGVTFDGTDELTFKAAFNNGTGKPR